MVSLDYTLLIQILNFLALIFILNVLLYKPILKVLDSRREKIAKADEEVKGLNESIEKKLAEYEDQIRAAKLEAMNKRTEIVQQGTAAAQEIIDAAKNDIAGMMENFQDKLAGEIEDARKVLNSQTKQISQEIAEKVLGRSIQ
ncbi:MAG: ATP synthase F0 subunit B [Syntrophales bacterium]|nr:ATP synthase F0 subunit B [Syntrophales bacterium]MDD5233736.1 ATP synthase F0 subunit B [Syntrophales bacterium]MDD5531502.1 ATP synthase F0 subunit B [Syntrophales bacterium]HPL63029.1 ATP synthase F0 subunit B [Syntrophales bacterium]